MKHFIAFLLLIGVYFLSTPVSQGMPSDSGINTENAKPARICFKKKGERICIKIKVNVELPNGPILTGSLVDGALVISGFSEDDNGVTFSASAEDMGIFYSKRILPSLPVTRAH